MDRRRKLGLSLFGTLSLLAGLVAATVSAAPTSATNLLTNPSFETGFSGGVASGWVKWALNIEPAYKQALSSTDATRVRDGSSSQQMEGVSFEYVAGVQQSVSGLIVGKTYKFSAYGQAWASSDDISTTSDGTISLKVGIGQGSTYAADPGITWSLVQAYMNSYGLLSSEVVAQDTTLTVFTYADTGAALAHNDTYWDNASLVEVGGATSTPESAGLPTQANVNLIAPTNFPLPTPDDSGQIIYYVQAGDNLVHIATIACGETPECLAKLKELNGISGSGSIIYPGQRLILRDVDAEVASPTVTPETEVTPDPGAGEVIIVDDSSPVEDSGDMEVVSEPGSTEEAEDVTPVQEEASGAICVKLYDDLNGNGVFDSGEGLVPGGTFTLVDMATGEALNSYNTDATDAESEPYCFTSLESGNYRVRTESPEGFTPTTRKDWDLTLAAGSTANLEFGSQLTGESEEPSEVTEIAGPLRPAIIGTVGVVLLLSAAGVAGYLVLTRRR